MTDEALLARLDEAVIRMRRLWSSPASKAVDEARWPGVELSTILVADAVRRLRRDRPGHEVTVAAVAARLDVAHSTASRLVDRAVDAGCLRRELSTEDARRAVLILTTRGEELVTEAEGYRHQFLGRVLTGWPARDIATLAELLARFADAVQIHAPHPTEGERP